MGSGLLWGAASLAAAALLLSSVRLLRGPTAADRAVALDVLRVEAEEFARLREENLAVFVGTGLMSPYHLNVEGQHLPGVIFALDLLRDVNLERPVEVGEKVVVVGGGNVAVDAARVCRRLGAEVTIAYRRRREDMPADEEEIEDAIAEGVELITKNIPLAVERKNRRLGFIWGPAEMLPAEPGRRPKPRLIEGVRHTIEADRVVAAIGQAPELSWLGDALEHVAADERGWITVDEDGATPLLGVFAGGDLVNPVADAISAVADGLRAVEGITRFAASAAPGDDRRA